MNLVIILQYVDPGTGSLLAQLLFSFLIGIGFYLLAMRRRLKNFFRRQPADQSEQDTSSEKSEPKTD